MSGFLHHHNKFWRGQYRSLSNFNLHPFHEDKEKSIIVGISCLFYLAPAILIHYLSIHLRWHTYYEILLYAITTLDSFIADYIYFGRKSIFQALDRWTASIAAFLNSLKLVFGIGFGFYINGFSAGLYRFSFIMFLVFISVPSLALSRKAQTQNTFVFFHTMWHLASSFGMCIVVLIECNDLNTFGINTNHDLQNNHCIWSI